MIRTVGVVYNPRIKEAVELSQHVHNLLSDLGCDVWLAQARDLDRRGLTPPRLDLILTLGGDGTILRAARLAAPMPALVLGVNMGQLGFLAELGPGDLLAQIPAIVNGGGWVEERLMLRATIPRQDAPPAALDGLNDLVIGRGQLPRALRVTVAINGQALATHVADGVIISTPTGSTAYALAMDGPIVHPEMRTLQVTPIAAHLAVVKSIVTPADARITLTVHTRHSAVASVDGQMDAPLGDGAVVEVVASPYRARFLRLQSRDYFYGTLVSRLSTTLVRGLL